jgi:thiol-disulfide isomerase/thioredoxin
MKYLVITILVCYSTKAFCQIPLKDSSIPYLNNPAVPPIKIITSINGKDTTWFTNDNLPKDKTIGIIYFSPECSHCQYEAKELVKAKEQLQNIFFVWVAYHPVSDNIAFAEKYQLNQMPNMVIGRDPKYFIPTFFRVEFTPYTAIYRKGKFVKEFREGVKIEELVEVAK